LSTRSSDAIVNLNTPRSSWHQSASGTSDSTPTARISYEDQHNRNRWSGGETVHEKRTTNEKLEDNTYDEGCKQEFVYFLHTVKFSYGAQPTIPSAALLYANYGGAFIVRITRWLHGYWGDPQRHLGGSPIIDFAFRKGYGEKSLQVSKENGSRIIASFDFVLVCAHVGNAAWEIGME